MGGSLAVTIREQDGTEHRMCRWTNPTPDFITSPLLCEKNPIHLASYLSGWREMRKDWKQSGENGDKCNLPMTPCYAPYPDLAPQDYGLVVVDMKNDVILSSQGYSGYGKVLGIGLLLDIKQAHNQKLPSERLASLRAFAKQGKVLGGKYYPSKFVDMQGWSYEDIISYVKKYEASNPGLDIIYNMDPFEVEKFSEDRDGIEAMHKRVLELGFKLSNEEEHTWKQYARSLDEDYEG